MPTGSFLTFLFREYRLRLDVKASPSISTLMISTSWLLDGVEPFADQLTVPDCSRFELPAGFRAPWHRRLYRLQAQTRTGDDAECIRDEECFDWACSLKLYPASLSHAHVRFLSQCRVVGRQHQPLAIPLPSRSNCASSRDCLRVAVHRLRHRKSDQCEAQNHSENADFLGGVQGVPFRGR